MQITVGFSEHPDSISAGREAAIMALSKSSENKPCDMVLLFNTARHNQELLREAVVSVIGESQRIYGGGAAGIITNDYFGYAGDQVGIACFWLEESSCNVLFETGLAESEVETGIKLGKKILSSGVKENTPMILFYDAIDRSQGDMRLLLASWLLDGIEKGVGFLPKIMGAGLQGDHSCTATMQYTGSSLEKHTALSMSFSDDICIDQIIMHGCRPASPYYTVTKAEGSVILEINGKPALSFIDEVLESSISPEQYPFFLLFGLNHGDKWGEYDENNYASRLCLDIDKQRGGIVMFEPDMVEGVEFQIMFRSLDLDYMKPKIKKLFDQLDGREPIFALYIDCAGRCAGYGGLDIEDALVIQQAVGKDIPLLGIYTGAEIAPMGGHSRGLDLTGVFCLFSKRKDGEIPINNNSSTKWNVKHINNNQEIPIKNILNLCENNVAKILKLDSESISIRHELEQKRRGFSLLAEFSVSLCGDNASEDLFFPVAQRINSALNMQKTVVLFPDNNGNFTPYVLQGYSVAEKGLLTGQSIKINPELLNPELPILVTAAEDNEYLSDLRKTLCLPYFISTPIVVKNEVAAILITGRMVEAPPFLCRLGRSEVETVQAIGALLASVLVYRKLDDANRKAQTDPLTGLLNRGALERYVTQRLQNDLSKKKYFAFMIIDCDYFKEINDNYGHMTGDMVLKTLSQILQKSFRANDVIARIGGDEFAVFCELINPEAGILERAEYLVKEWNKTILDVNTQSTVSSSVSVGIAFAPRDGNAYDELFHRADMALYRSKQQGRNRFTVYNSKTMNSITPNE